ncbi:MAG TPA: hypothetical protein ENI73_08330, partial [Spirochaetes bacterium]|nr:hypothetical protein [Spirochaetota bacterium]
MCGRARSYIQGRGVGKEFSVTGADETKNVYLLAKETQTPITYVEDEFSPTHTMVSFEADLFFDPAANPIDSTKGVYIGQLNLSSGGTVVSAIDNNGKIKSTLDLINVSGAFDPLKLDLLPGFNPAE